MRVEKTSGKSIRVHTGRFKKSMPGYQEAQNHLDTLEEKTRKAYREYLQQGIVPTPDLLKAALAPKAATVVHLPKAPDFLSLYDALIDNNKVKYRSADTMRTFKTVRKDLQHFHITCYPLDIQQYSLEVHNRLIDYWLNVLNIHPNTMATRIKNSKAAE